MEEEIYQAPLYKRIISSLLDIIVTTLLSIGLFMLLINGAVDIGFHNLNYKISQYKLQEQTELFDIKKDSSGNFLEISKLSYEVSNTDEYKVFAAHIHTYYFTYLNNSDKSEANFNKKYMLIDENTLRNPVFSVSSMNDNYENYVLLDEVTDVSTKLTYTKEDGEKYYNAIKNFFTDGNKGVYNLALTEFTNSSRFQSIANNLAVVERIEILICVAFSSLIFMAIPILLNKNGETAFMHVLGICFTDSYGYKVKWRHKIIRAIVVIIINSASTYLYGIPLAVNAIVMFITSEKRSLVDYASNETSIDKKTSVILAE